MSELKPVAWSLEYNGTHVTADKSLAMSLKADGVPVAPLYAIPDGYVALPSVLNSNQIKKAAGHLMANGYDGISAAENVLMVWMAIQAYSGVDSDAQFPKGSVVDEEV